jgi:hypothetical protein
VRFFYTNLIDVTGVTFTTSSAASSALGGSNVAHEFKSKVWRTTAVGATEYVLFDLGSAKAVTAAIVFNHTLTASDSNITIRASTDNFVASDVLVTNLTHATTMSAVFGSVSYRYWMFKFQKSAAGETRDVGRVFIGNYTDVDNIIDWAGLDVQPEDLSVRNRTAGGQLFTDRRSQYRRFKVQLSGISTANKNTVKTISEAVGTHTSFFAQVATSGTGEISEILYVKLRDAFARKVSGMDSSDLAWDATLELEEQL